MSILLHSREEFIAALSRFLSPASLARYFTPPLIMKYRSLLGIMRGLDIKISHEYLTGSRVLGMKKRLGKWKWEEFIRAMVENELGTLRLALTLIKQDLEDIIKQLEEKLRSS